MIALRAVSATQLAGSGSLRLIAHRCDHNLAIIDGDRQIALPTGGYFSPDGHQLASAAYDKTVRLWDLSTRRHRVLRGHTAPVIRVAWRDDQHLVTGSWDATIRVWDAPSLELPSALELARLLDAATTARITADRPATGKPESRGT